MNKCPNCKTKLITDHAFCPKCGFDMRPHKTTTDVNIVDVGKPDVPSNEKQIVVAIEAIDQLENRATESTKNPNTPLIVAVAFAIISIFIWCFVYTNWKFDPNFFARRLINHSFWIILVPWLISRFFKKESRTRVHYNAVKAFVFIGCILLVMGYIQTSDTQNYYKWKNDSSMDIESIRSKLQQPCMESIISKIDRLQITAHQKSEMATVYCDCILQKLSSDELVSIDTQTKSFWRIIEDSHVDDSKICAEKQFSILDK